MDPSSNAYAAGEIAAHPAGGTPLRSVSEIIDQGAVSRFQLRAISLCGLVMVLDGFNAQNIGYIGPAIAAGLHVPIKSLGPIFSAGLFGLMLAAMASGPIADRWGRKWPIVISTVAFGIFSLLTAHASTANQLLVFRFLTGLGLGGAMPNIVALASEYVPKRLQHVVVAGLFAGMPLGGVMGGLAASTMNWRSVFALSGTIPLIMAVFLIALLPESVRFLSLRPEHRQRMTAILAKISPGLGATPLAQQPAVARPSQGLPLKHLFTEGRAAGTILLWIPFFMNLLMLYFAVSWLPALLREAGLPAGYGVTATTLFSVGGILGCFAEGPLLRRAGAHLLLLIEFVLCAVMIGSLAFVIGWFPAVAAVSFALGFFVTGAQAGINAAAAAFYPTAIRSTGIGWALGVGRIGSIVGPMVASLLLAIGWRPQQIFLSGVGPALIAAVAILLSYKIGGAVNAYHVEPALSVPVRTNI